VYRNLDSAGKLLVLVVKLEIGSASRSNSGPQHLHAVVDALELVAPVAGRHQARAARQLGQVAESRITPGSAFSCRPRGTRTIALTGNQNPRRLLCERRGSWPLHRREERAVKRIVARSA